MSISAKILSELVLDYLDNASTKETRLLVPVPTKLIGIEMQRILLKELGKAIPTYLVITNGDGEPSEENGWIDSEGLTSLRVGSLVLIVLPGNISKIQESVIGAISMSFSDDWPWSNEKTSSHFSFENAFILKLMNHYWLSDEVSEGNHFFSSIFRKIISSTLQYSDRSSLLFDDIIDSFNFKSHVGDLIEFLYHSGLPNIAKDCLDAKVSINEVEKDIIRISKLISDNQRETLLEKKTKDIDTKLINALYDGVGHNEPNRAGVLSLRNNLSPLNKETWEKATIDRLFSLFDEDRKPESLLESHFLTPGSPDATYISPDAKFLIGKEESLFGIHCKWKINSSINHRVDVKCGKNLLHSLPIENLDFYEKESSFTFSISDPKLWAKGNDGKKKKISVELIKSGEVIKKNTLNLSMLCEQYNEFLIIEDPFTLVSYDEGEEAIKPVTTTGPFNITLVSSAEPISLSISNSGHKLELKPVVNSTVSWTTLNAFQATNFLFLSQVRLQAEYRNSRKISVDIEAEQVEKGFLTIEEKLLNSVILDSSDKKKVLDIFSGKNRNEDTKLGGLTPKNEFRIKVAKQLENRPADAYYYLLGGGQEILSFKEEIIGKNIINLIEQYETCRKQLINFYSNHFIDKNSNSSHPIYARIPTYIENKSSEIEELICEYLLIYQKVSQKLGSGELNKLEEFRLIYLDCIVFFDNEEFIDYPLHDIFLIGPWHPLQVATRFQRQKAVYFGCKHSQAKQNKGISKMAGILLEIQGIRAIQSYNGHGNYIHAYVSDTSDLNWSLAMKARQSQSILYLKPSIRVSKEFGVTVDITPQSSSFQVKLYIKNYLNANPSKRRLDIYFQDGFDVNEVYLSVQGLFVENPAIKWQLPGGVHLFFQNVEMVFETETPESLIYIYSAPDQKICLAENSIDLFISSPQSNFEPQTVSSEKFRDIPRGLGISSALTLPLPLLREGRAGVPNSIYQEAPFKEVKTDDLVSEQYLKSIRLIPTLISSTGFEIVKSIDLPKALDANWVVLPGHSIDPAMLSELVNSESIANNEKVLWDYNVDLLGKQSDYFILSDIASGFEHAMLTSKFSSFDSKLLFRDLSRVGIAIGGEALRSGMKALGVIGQIGAVRLFSGSSQNPVKDGPDLASIIIPVDSFDSILGSGSRLFKETNKKSDLVVIQLALIERESQELIISATSVEAKYSSSTFLNEVSALEQAQATLNRLKFLVRGAAIEEGVIERLVLAKLVKYGLQLKAHKLSEDLEKRNYLIINHILNGKIKWNKAKYESIVCSSEADLEETSYQKIEESGLRVRLSPTQWPGEHETEKSIRDLRDELLDNFDATISLAYLQTASFGFKDSEEKSLNIKVQHQKQIEYKQFPEEEILAADNSSLRNFEGKNGTKYPEHSYDNKVMAIDKPKNIMNVLPEDELKNRYKSLLKVFRGMGLDIFQPEDGKQFITEGPASVLYRIELSPENDPNKIKNQKERLHLHLKLEQGQELRIYSHLGYMFIDVPKQSSERYFVEAEWLWQQWEKPENGLSVPLGINQRKELFEISFSSSESPHLLIGGTTGGGKSEALYTILKGLTKHYSSEELKLALIDPKGNELLEFQDSPNLIGDIGSEPIDTIEILKKCVDEMERRNKQLFRGASNNIQRINSFDKYNSLVEKEERLPWWLIVLDEYQDLTSEKEDKKEIEKLLSRLAAKARSAGIHIILATQKPSGDVISTSLRANLPAQLALKVKSHNESRVIIDDTGAETLTGKGDAFLKIGNEMHRIQCGIIR